MNKKWVEKPFNKESAAHLREVLGIHPKICQVLAGRGIDTYETAKDFFRPQLGHLHDPLTMRGMKEALERITEARDAKEKICVFGDYDVDGTTSVSLVYIFLREHISEDLLSFFIPNRYNEGYGLSAKGIEEAAAQGCSLMIVLDCGIQSVQLVQYAKTLGIDTIICDHHLPGEELPEAIAILNPKQALCTYPYKELSGCGIGYKLICGLQAHWNSGVDPSDYLELVAASIASDIVHIDGENRILAYFGLKKINEDPSLPFRILKDVGGKRMKMSIANLVFLIGPKINAAGRMNDAAKVVRFFISKNEKEMREIAQELHVDNEDRRGFDMSITAEASAILEDEMYRDRKSIVLHQAHWHKGVVGIVASRILEQHYKPTIILTSSQGIVTGSARSVQGFDIHAALSACAGHLMQFGGHQFAAGMSLLPQNLPHFIEAFEEVVQATITEDSLEPKIYIDAPLDLKDVSYNFLKIIQQFEPCGPQNTMPVFMTKNLKDSGLSRVVKGVHLQVHLAQNDVVMKGIAFNMARWIDHLKAGKAIDIVFHLEANEWQGVTTPELRILDIKASN